MSLKTNYEPLSDGMKLRLYNSNICPYAQRPRLVLAAKGIPYELSEIDLTVPRPDWYLKNLNPNGTVPSMLHNGHNIYESLVCCDYIEEVYPEPTLYHPDPLKRAFERIYIQTWASKGIPAFYKLYKEHPITDEGKENLLNVIGKMDSLLKAAKSDYFSGTNKPGMADYMIWPWFERISFMKDLVGLNISESNYPSITSWISRLLKDKVAQEANTNKDIFTASFKKYHPED